MSALEIQIGGDHYKKFTIQPAEFSTKNGLGFLEGCIIKRLCRKKHNDLLKIKHEVDLLIEFESSTVIEETETETETEKMSIRTFSADLINLIDTQNEWTSEDLKIVLKALIKNKYND